MNSDVTRVSSKSFSSFFNPFPKSAVTIFTAPTYTGKSYLVKQILLNQDKYFLTPLTRVFVLSCNQQAAIFEFETENKNELENDGNNSVSLPNLNFELLVLPLEDFNLDVLQPNDLVILEDVQTVTASIRVLINISAHHEQLAGVFVICQGLLGTKIFELLSFCHQIVLFMQSTSVSRLASYIVTHFYQDPDLKAYLKTCISYAEKQKTVFLLEINSISSKQIRHHIAVSHLQKVADKEHPFAVVHPHPGRMTLYQKTFANCKTDCNEIHDASNENDMQITPLPETSFLLVSAQNVSNCVKTNVGAASDLPQCSTWEKVVENIQELIEQNFPAAKWMLVKNVAREILRNQQFCLTEDGRMMSLKFNPSTPAIPVLDFLITITRQQGPNERFGNQAHLKKYVAYAKQLLSNNTPSSYFKNKYFLQTGKKLTSNLSSRRHRLQQQQQPLTNNFSAPHFQISKRRRQKRFQTEHNVNNYSSSAATDNSNRGGFNYNELMF
jgi:hypothetical protein